MAKIAQPYAEASVAPTEIVLEIKGLVPNGDGTFTLTGVKPVNLDHQHFEAMIEALQDQGVDLRKAERFVEEAHMSIQDQLLADAIAQRTRRVG